MQINTKLKLREIIFLATLITLYVDIEAEVSLLTVTVKLEVVIILGEFSLKFYSKCLDKFVLNFNNNRKTKCSCYLIF